MASLRAAAISDDAALDWALLRVGILAPADLAPIRAELSRPGATLRATVNRDGHRIVEVIDHGHAIAQILNDGTITPVTPV